MSKTGERILQSQKCCNLRSQALQIMIFTALYHLRRASPFRNGGPIASNIRNPPFPLGCIAAIIHRRGEDPHRRTNVRGSRVRKDPQHGSFDVDARKLCVEVALARGKRETGQDLSVAAISDVLLCEGLFHTAPSTAMASSV
jgi:hypothetical protein